MFEVLMLVPLADNDGEVFSSEHFMAFEVVILDSFPGFSMLPDEIVGAWRNDAGVVYRDRSRCYVIGLSSLSQGAAVVALARYAKAWFRQEAIAIRYLGTLEII
jgi:hypothetical protein